MSKSIENDLITYLNSFRNAQSLEKKLEICQMYSDKEWRIGIGIIAGIIDNNYWIVNPDIPAIGKVTISIPMDIWGSGRYVCKVPELIEVISTTNCELVACRKL